MNEVPNFNDPLIRTVPDDGLYLPVIKRHSLEKIERHNYYARLFSTGMKARWPQRAYIGLYSGAGCARVKETGEVVETTALSVLRLPDPFTHYIYVDKELQCTTALSRRVSRIPGGHNVAIIQGDVNEKVGEIRRAVPTFSRDNGLLSFCFVDPFSAELKFSTLAALGSMRVDFLILLMLGLDARLNFRQYFEDETSTRIADLIDCPDWRTEFASSKDQNVVRFLTTKFDEGMTRIGYRSASPSHYHRVNVHGKGVMQYVLVLYSKHVQGQKFWEKSLSGLDRQMTLGL